MYKRYYLSLPSLPVNRSVSFGTTAGHFLALPLASDTNIIFHPSIIDEYYTHSKYLLCQWHNTPNVRPDARSKMRSSVKWPCRCPPAVSLRVFSQILLLLHCRRLHKPAPFLRLSYWTLFYCPLKPVTAYFSLLLIETFYDQVGDWYQAEKVLGQCVVGKVPKPPLKHY